MVIPKVVEQENIVVFEKRLSSVVPGKISGENKTYELKGIDLAMKLHYIKGLYFFNDISVSSNLYRGFIQEIKKPMFDWLIPYFMVCGRIRLPSSIKLNDAGIRIVEARCSITVDEWLAMLNFPSLNHHLLHGNALGPEVSFSPLVCIQVTLFRCGGISVGLSWAHVLGDAFSATEFMNMLDLYIQGHLHQPKTLVREDHPEFIYPPSIPAQEPVSVKRVNPVNNNWIVPSNCRIGTHAFHLTPEQLSQLHSRVYNCERNDKSGSQFFEVITAIMWKSIAKIRSDLEMANRVTICRPKTTKREEVVPFNGQILGRVEADFSIQSAEPLQLVRLIVERIADESETVEELVKKETGRFDFFVYGANLTFVDMENANVYGFRLEKRFPRFAIYGIDGIGDEGVVLVLPGPKDEDNSSNGGKLIVIHLPENEIEPLKKEIKEEWCIE